MAVEAHHLRLSESQPIQKTLLNAPFPSMDVARASMVSPQRIDVDLLLSDHMNTNHSFSDAQGNTNMLFATPMCGATNGMSPALFSLTVAACDSGLTSNATAAPAPRKKQRILGGQALAMPFSAENLSSNIHHQQLEIDRLIAFHAEKMRAEVTERRRRISRQMLVAVEIAVARRMQSKQEEIYKITKLNWELEQKIRDLCVENQIWRNLAQNNEAAANALRSNLEQVLAEHQFRADEDPRGGSSPAAADDAASCCGDNEQLITAASRRYLSSTAVNRR